MIQEVEVAPGVDFEALARLAEGYSGDDISGVCRDAAMASMRRKVAGKTPDEIRQGSAASLESVQPQPVHSGIWAISNWQAEWSWRI